MRFFLGVILLFSAFILPAQQVINAAGSTRTDTDSGISITDNVGEPFVQTVSAGSVMITEGYLQPFVIAPGFNVSILKSDLSCSDIRDGKIAIKIKTHGYQNYIATYDWSPASQCKTANCSTIDSLDVGTYSLSIRVTYTTSAGIVKNDSSFQQVSVYSPNGPCQVLIHSGFTPNGDDLNDNWIIGNINVFPKNKVSIFNRWGEEVYNSIGYNNTSEVWPGSNDKLVASTYFYIIDLGNGTKPIKGWVELIK